MNNLYKVGESLSNSDSESFKAVVSDGSWISDLSDAVTNRSKTVDAKDKASLIVSSLGELRSSGMIIVENQIMI